jgi:PBSX family phage portal protein
MNEPFAFATKGGAVVLKETLDQYAIKTNYQDEKDPFQIKVSAEKSNANENSKQTPEVLNTNYGMYGLIEPPFNPLLLASLTDLNTYHSSSVKTKAVDVAGLGWRLEPLVDKPSPKEEMALNEFFNNCKPLLSEVLNRAAEDEEQIGYGCLELIREGGLSTGKPKRLEHIHGHTIRIHMEKNRFMQTWDGINRRWFKYIDETDANDKPFDVHAETGEILPRENQLPPEQLANDLIYDYNYTSKTGYYGTPDYIPAIRTMIGDQSAVDYNLVWFKNFGLPAYAIFITGDFKDEAVKDNDGNPIKGTSVLQKAIEDKFKKTIGEPGSGMILMLPNDNNEIKVEVRFEKLSVEIKDSSFRFYREANRNEILASHRMDPHQIGVILTGTLGGDTAQQSNKNYKNRVVTPRQRRWEALINKHIIWADTGFGFKDWSFKLKEIDTDDDEQDFRIDQGLFMIAGARPVDIINKWAAKRGFTISEEMKTHPALNAYYVNNSPITLDIQPAEVNNVVKVLEDLKVGVKEAVKSYETEIKSTQ